MNSPDHEAVLEHLSWVQRLAHRICVDAALAEDVSQEAMLAAFRQPAPADARGDNGGGLRRWLGGIVRNQVRMARRAERRRGKRENRLQSPANAMASDEIVERASTQRAVVEAVLALDEPYRTTLLRRYFDDLGPQAIADLEGLPLATVKTRLRRGLERLRERLPAALGESDDGRSYLRALVPLAMMELRRRGAAPTAPVGGAASTLLWPGLAAAGVVLAVGLAVWGSRWGGTTTVPREEARAAAAPAVSATRDGRGDVALREAIVPAAEPGANQSAPAPTIRVEVTALDTMGGPVAAIPVAVTAPRSWPPSASSVTAVDTGTIVGRTDVHGRVTYEQPAATRRVVSAADEWLTVLAGTAFPYRSATTVRLVVGQRRRVEGTVVGPGGTPVAAAQIEYRSSRDLRTLVDVPVDQVSTTSWTTTSDDRGAFVFPAVPALPDAVLRVTAWDFETGSFGVQSHGPAVVECSMQARRNDSTWLQGTVRDAAGLPLADAAVSMDHVAAWTERSGRFRLDIAAAEHRGTLWVAVPGVAAQQFARPRGGWPRTLNLTLAARSHELSGRVLDRRGRPVANARVLLADPTAMGFLPTDGSAMLTVASLEEFCGGHDGPVETAGDGRFRWRGLLARPYRLVVVVPDQLRAVVAGPFEAGSTGLTIRLPDPFGTVQVAGQVRSSDGEPVRSASVRLLRQVEGHRVAGPRTLTDAEGRFAFSQSVPGDCELQVFAGGDYGVWGAPLSQVADSSELAVELTVELPVLGSFYVRRSSRSAAVDRFALERRDGAPVMLQQIDGGGAFQIATGSFEGERSPVFRVPLGHYVLVVRKGERDVERVPLVVTGGATKGITL
ncbi:MAG: sigma-70 family RNA polymerase sigma factor [bacterium]|nr:sigma-70 family RNA polymerase sigma factor [bacterium]